MNKGNFEVIIKAEEVTPKIYNRVKQIYAKRGVKTLQSAETSESR